MTANAPRRPLASRGTAWAKLLTGWLCRSGVTPNQISGLSIVFGAAAAWLLLLPNRPWALLLAALAIQLRLLCNLMDGLVAIEGGKGGPTGSLWNEVPDRVADSLPLIAAGYAVALPELGWLAALLAMATAYLRLLGGSLGQPQDFGGPQAKPHRMALLTLACLAAAAEVFWLGSLYALAGGLALIVLGTALTCGLRLQRLARWLRGKSAVTTGRP